MSSFKVNFFTSQYDFLINIFHNLLKFNLSISTCTLQFSFFSFLKYYVSFCVRVELTFCVDAGVTILLIG